MANEGNNTEKKANVLGLTFAEEVEPPPPPPEPDFGAMMGMMMMVLMMGMVVEMIEIGGA